MKKLLLIAAMALLTGPALAEREFDIDGPMELHVWITAQAGHEADFEKTFSEVFYPAISRQEGFRSAALMRKPGTADYTIRLSFDTEDLRMEWVKSEHHQKAWPALAAHGMEPKWQGFAVKAP